MSMAHPGSAIVSCLAFLDNVRSVPDKHACIAFDATLYYAPSFDSENSKITCTLWYQRQSPMDIIAPGLYEIVAKVIALETPGHNLHRHGGANVCLLRGDILELRPSALPATHRLNETGVIARLTAAGHVAGRAVTGKAFFTTISQHMLQTTPLSEITIRAIMGHSEACKRPYQRLPEEDDVVAFTGRILGVEWDGVIVVSVDDIAFFPHPLPSDIE